MKTCYPVQHLSHSSLSRVASPSEEIANLSQDSQSYIARTYLFHEH